MRIGIIAEGTEDQAVIRLILKAYGVDGSDMVDIRPSLQRDATDAADPSIGTFQGVKNACEGKDGLRPDFERFFIFPDNEFMVIHLDTAEIDNQDFTFDRPLKEETEFYAKEMRGLVINLINNWLDGNYQNKILYAIAIEEIEAWCLTIYVKTDSIQSANAKRKFWYEVNKRKVKSGSNNPADFCKDFSKLKKLKTCLPYNQSLKDFADSVEADI